MESGSIKISFSWQPPRRWLYDEFKLAALPGTREGTIRFWVESENLWAECEYPLICDWKTLVEADRSMPFVHGRDTDNLARVLGVIIGSPTNVGVLMYESPGVGSWGPMTNRLTRTLWDYPGYPPVSMPESDVAKLLLRSLGNAGLALPLLAESLNVGNPVARFLCVWQALVFHVGVDRPFEVERDFFGPIGVPAQRGPHGRETKYTRFRNMLSHPKGREVPEYAELDAEARELADELALLLLQHVMGRS